MAARICSSPTDVGEAVVQEAFLSEAGLQDLRPVGRVYLMPADWAVVLFRALCGQGMLGARQVKRIVQVWQLH